MRIGVISDTHGFLHPRVREVFAGVRHIIHAGDIGGGEIIAALEAIAPVTAVRGNNDEASGLDVRRVTLGGLHILITHILPRPSKPGRHVLGSLARHPADLVVFGHSHLPHNEVIDGVRFLNPASAGPARFNYPVAVAMIDSGKAWHIALDDRSAAALRTRMNQMR